jgi:hypothetical protein
MYDRVLALAPTEVSLEMRFNQVLPLLGFVVATQLSSAQFSLPDLFDWQ